MQEITIKLCDRERVHYATNNDLIMQEVNDSLYDK